MVTAYDRDREDSAFAAVTLISAAVTGAGALWAIGRWQLGLPSILPEFANAPPVQPLTALCIAMWSVALFAAGQQMRILAVLAALVLAAFAGVRLGEIGAGVDYRLDILLFPNAFEDARAALRIGGATPEAMPISFLCLAVAVICRPRFPRASNVLLIVPAGIAAASLTAMMLGLNGGAGLMAWLNMSRPMNMGTLLAVVGCLCLEPQPAWIARRRRRPHNGETA